MLVVMIFERELKEPSLGNILDIGLRKVEKHWSAEDVPQDRDSVHTRLMMPCGCGLSSARLAKNSKPLPVWVA